MFLWATFGSEGIHLALSLHDGLLNWGWLFGQVHQVLGSCSQCGQCILERLLVFLDLGSFTLLRLTFTIDSGLVVLVSQLGHARSQFTLSRKHLCLRALRSLGQSFCRFSGRHQPRGRPHLKTGQ